jgi:hypothetical protein
MYPFYGKYFPPWGGPTKKVGGALTGFAHSTRR